MRRYTLEQYVRDYIDAADDGTLKRDELADFVIDAIYEELEIDVTDIVDNILA